MTLKSSYKYQLYDNIKPLTIYYGIVLVLMVLLASVMTINISGSINGSVGGMEITTSIFIFILGLNSFKENFLMLSQNGVSRKTVFVTRILVFITVVFAMTAIDNIIVLIGKALTANNIDLGFYSLFEQIYSPEKGILTYIKIFEYNFLMYTVFVMFGYFLTSLFYRLNKTGKIAVGAGVPVFLCIIFPIADALLFKGKATNAFWRFADFALGISSRNFYAPMITFAALTVIFGLCSWILIRRAVVKA